MLKSKTSRWLAGPYLLWMAIFTVVPLVIVVWYAMTNTDGQFTLDNLTQIGRYSSVFARSLILAAISTVVCLVMAFPVGYFLSRLRANKQHIMLMLIMLPMWMNFLLRTYAWMTLLEKNGLINKFFGLFGLGPFNMINTSGAVVLGMVYNYLPFMILPIYTAMTKIDDSIVEAAQDLGCNVWQILFRVLVPLTGPGIATGITQVFVPAVSTFIISRMLGGGSNLLIGDLIELQFLGNSYNLNLGSAMSLVLMVIVLLCMSFTLGWYKSLFHNEMILSALGLSLVLALVSSVIATVLGTLATIGINSMSRRSQLIINNISYVPVVNPEIITGVSLMLLFVMAQSFGIGGESGIFGWPTLLIAHITFNIPYVIFNVGPKLRQLDPSLYNAALDLGCTPRQAFSKVIMPQLSPAILSAFLICLTYSIDDFMISYFNSGTMQTLPIAIYSMTRKKVSPEINALSAVMFCVILAIILISNAADSRAYRRNQKAIRKAMLDEGGR